MARSKSKAVKGGSGPTTWKAKRGAPSGAVPVAPRKTSRKAPAKRVAPVKRAAVAAAPRRAPRRAGGVKRPKRAVSPALAQVKKLLGNRKLFIRKQPFQRLVRHMVNSHAPGSRVSAAALLSLQIAIEEILGASIRDSSLAMEHANRETLYPADIELQWKLKNMDRKLA